MNRTAVSSLGAELKGSQSILTIIFTAVGVEAAMTFLDIQAPGKESHSPRPAGTNWGSLLCLRFADCR